MKISNNPLNSYLTISIKIFRIYTINLILSIIFINQLIKPFKEDYLILVEFITVLPFILVLILSPLGMFYSWKSYKLKEEPRKKRTIFFMGHMFFCTAIILFVLTVIKDLSTIN